MNTDPTSPSQSTFQSFVSTLDLSGKQFEHFVKWFLENDPEWSTTVEKVWLWDDWPGRWGPDCGIDLVINSKTGETWAVQAKQYSVDYYITKNDVDSFLSESNRAEIDRRLLIATTDHIGPNGIRTIHGQEKPVTCYLANDFEHSECSYPESFDQLFRSKRKPKPTPFPYQEAAIRDVVEGFEHAHRGQLIMACGTGKTYTTLWIKERLKAANTLVLVPSLNLLAQTLREWTGAANEPFDVMCVCSDEGVAKRGADDPITDPQDAPFPVYSDTHKIRSFLSRNKNKVVFCTYQSSHLIAEVQRDRSILPFDLVVADEAHRCAGKVDTAFATVLDASLIKARRRLFATATPRTYTTSLKRSAAERGIDVVGMDDPEVFGEQFHLLSFSAAIDHDPPLLTDYQVVVIGVNDEMVAEWIRDRELLSTDMGDSIDAESLAAQIGCIKAIRDYGIKRAISFHSRVKAAQHFSEDIQTTLSHLKDNQRPRGTIWTDHVSGAMPTDKRLNKLKILKELYNADFGVLSNARCLSEGVDVPTLDGVMFIDPKSSQVDIVQAVGRAIRLSDDKHIGTIVLPVFVGGTDDPELAIETSRYKPIWDVVNALRSHDQVLSDELDHIRTELGRRRVATIVRGRLSKIVFDLPQGVSDSFAESLATTVVERSTASWEFWYGVLETYASEQGDCLVPGGYETAEGLKLGIWTSNQRANRDRLSKEQQSRLDSLGFVWDALEHKWSEGFSQLQAYVAEHGDCFVPQGYKTKQGYNLSRWVQAQRERKALLPNSRIARLDEINFVWNAIDAKWEKGFRSLVDYEGKAGDCDVPTDYRTSDGFSLGKWVATQRTKKQQKTLSAEQMRRLKGLGFAWNAIDYRWERGVAKFEDFVLQHGDGHVPRNYKTDDGFELGKWASAQRENKNSLSQERKKRLDALGFVWEVYERKWKRGKRAFREYMRDFGDARVPATYETAEGFKLGQWVGMQRRWVDKIGRERIAQLDELGFVWDPSQEDLSRQWHEGFSRLEAYTAEHGDCLVPYSYRTHDGFNLGIWVSNRRQGRDLLSAERITQLDELGFVWDQRQEDLSRQWHEGFSRLEAYVDEHGECLVPARYRTPDGFKLGTWVSNRRKDRDSLSAERIESLEALGFVWAPLEQQWEEALAQLTDYIEQHGDCNVPKGFKTPDGKALGSWVSKQRNDYKKDQISAERIERLEALGFVWDPYHQQWEEGFAQLTDYIEQHGDYSIPRKFKTSDGKALGDWAGDQRKAFRKSQLSAERIERLEALGFVWDSLEQQWEEALAQLTDYIEQHGDCNVPKGFKTPDGKALGSWVSTQREAYKKDQISAERIARLEALGFEW